MFTVHRRKKRSQTQYFLKQQIMILPESRPKKIKIVSRRKP